MSHQTIIFPVSKEDCEDIEKWFGPPNPAMTSVQDMAVNEINAGARSFCGAILRSIPKCADRSAAIRKVREAALTAVHAVIVEKGAYVNRTPIRNG